MAELGEKHWYIVNTYSQHENKVADNLRKRIDSLNLKDKIFNVLVAEETVPVIDKETGLPKEGKFKKKNLFPGHIFVEMIMTDEAWFIVRNTEGVTGIAGSAGRGLKPTPVSKSEMEPVLKRMNMIDSSMYEGYNPGDGVKILDGALEGSEAVIESINKETGVCHIKTFFFGRETPMDVEISEIEKI